MRHSESLTYSDNAGIMWMDDSTTDKNEKKPKQEGASQKDEYDESWDHIYDYNEFENKRRRLNRSDKYKYNKQDW